MQLVQNILSPYNGQDMELSVKHTKESVLFALDWEMWTSLRERTFQAVFTSSGCKTELGKQTFMG